MYKKVGQGLMMNDDVGVILSDQTLVYVLGFNAHLRTD